MRPLAVGGGNGVQELKLGSRIEQRLGIFEWMDVELVGQAGVKA